MSTFQYDPLEVLNRAQRSADDWWSNTLNNAKKRTDLDQQHFENAFENDRMMQTYSNDLFKTNAENQYRGTKAQYDTMLEPDRYDSQKEIYGMQGNYAKMRAQDYGFALEPDNVDARRTMANDRYQSPVAKLEGNAAAAGIADREQANNVAAMTAAYRPGALSAQTEFGRQSTDTGSFNIGADISMGNFGAANDSLEKSGLGIRVEQAEKDGMVYLVDQNGRRSMPMDASAAARYVQDRTGQKPGQAQTYADNRATENRKFDQQTSINDAKMAQKDRYIQFRLNSDQGKALVAEFKAAQSTGDKAKIDAAWNNLQSFKYQANRDFDNNVPGSQGPSQGIDDVLTGKPATPTQPVQQQGATPVVYAPPSTQAPSAQSAQNSQPKAQTKPAAQPAYWTPESGTKPTEAQLKALYDRWQSLQPSWYMPKPASSHELDAAERAYEQALAKR